LKTLCLRIESTDNAHSDALAHEVSVVNAFISAVESDEAVLADGEPVEAEDIDEGCYAQATQRLKQVARGEDIPEGPYPLQDSLCHYPGCDDDHEHYDDHFHEHCACCHAWLHINMPINILRHSENGELVTCYECTTSDEYLEGGYTDDAGKLQCIRADDADTLLRLADTACKRAGIPGIVSGQAFYKQRYRFMPDYESAMNSTAKDWNMGDDDNFQFLKDYANDRLEELYAS
jgi:hypothetical protein